MFEYMTAVPRRLERLEVTGRRFPVVLAPAGVDMPGTSKLVLCLEVREPVVARSRTVSAVEGERCCSPRE
jgi:hypothetical protein